MGAWIREHDERAPALADIQERMDTAEEILAVSVSHRLLSTFEPHLAAATDRGVLVLVLVTGTDSVDADRPLEELGTVVRVTERSFQTRGFVDGRWGWSGEHRLLLDEDVTDRTISVVESPDIAHALYASFLGVYWETATEASVVDPKPLPATYDRFQRGVIDATIRLRDEQLLRATARGREVESGDPVTVTGLVTNSRQSYVYPVTADIYGTNGLLIETDDGTRYSLGGERAYLEDIEVQELRLDTPPD